MNAFDPEKFYDKYAMQVALRPGYPARAQYKSTIIWSHFGKLLMNNTDKVDKYADIGGCFGFGANCLAYHIAQAQDKRYPDTFVFELAKDYTRGRQLFPYINFIIDDFIESKEGPRVYDLVSLFDVVEHVIGPDLFLQKCAKRTRHAFLMTPLETAGDWRGGRKLHNQYGDTHPEGHVNFFNINSYNTMLADSGFELVGEHRFLRTLTPRFGNPRAFFPESVPSRIHIRSPKQFITVPLHAVCGILLPASIYRKVYGACHILSFLRSKELAQNTVK